MITGVEKVACSFISDADEKDSGKFAMKRDTIKIASGIPSAMMPASMPRARADPLFSSPCVGMPYFARDLDATLDFSFATTLRAERGDFFALASEAIFSAASTPFRTGRVSSSVGGFT